MEEEIKSEELYHHRLDELVKKKMLGTKRISDAEDQFSRVAANKKLDEAIIPSIEDLFNATLFAARARNDHLWVQAMDDADVAPEVILRIWDLMEKLRDEAREAR